MRLTPTELSEVVSRRAIAKANGLPIPPPTASPADQITKPGMRIRQSEIKLNALEREFQLVLKTDWRTLSHVRAQAIRFRLANGVSYTPDFTAIDSDGQFAFEVKGEKAWDDSIVKLKVAASTYPEIRWVLVWKDAGGWKSQIVNPVVS